MMSCSYFRFSESFDPTKLVGEFNHYKSLADSVAGGWKATRRSGHEQARDRISNLPDAILVHILSFLPTEYAVRTSILSTRWKNLWKSVANLCFDSNSIAYIRGSRRKQLEAESAFVKFVNTVLLLRDFSDIDKFHLQCSYIHDMASVITWIRFAIKCHVQELLVETSMEVELLKLPQMLFMSESLEVLSLKAAVLDDPDSVRLPNLKSLCLNVQKYAKGESMQKIISGCPAIETLILAGWERDDEPSVVDCISMPTMKAFYWYRSKAFKFSIDAPKLEYLYVYDEESTAFSMKNLTSLVEAYVDVSGCHGDRVYKLLRGIKFVKHLQLSSPTLESLPLFYQLTHLELRVRDKSDWNSLPRLLGCSPFLEVAVFKNEELGWSNKDCKWEKPDLVPHCLLFRLQEVTMRLGIVDQLKIVVMGVFSAKCECSGEVHH